MKKKSRKPFLIIGTLAAIIIAAVIYFVFFSFKTISEKKVDAFLTDSQNAFVYLLSQNGAEMAAETENDAETEDGSIDSNLAQAIAANTYAARNKDALTEDDGAYLIPAADLETESENLFWDYSNDSSEDYLLNIADSSEDQQIFTIVDSFYGYIGSEPTELTVRYTLGDKECEVDYSLVYDKESPYTFKITDMVVR